MTAIPEMTSAVGGATAGTICHYCLASSQPLTFPCSRTFCRGSARYCSGACRDDDASAEGFHSEYRCRFVGMYCCRQVPPRPCSTSNGERPPYPLVQIAIADEEFPVYRRAGCEEATGGEVVDGDFSPSATSPPVFAPTGEHLRCRIGDVGRVVLGPHLIDAAGSVLLCLVRRGDDKSDVGDAERNAAGGSLYILSDVSSLCGAPPESVRLRNSTSEVRRRSRAAWMRGVGAWYNDKDYRGAMDWFEESLSEVCWMDDEDDASEEATNRSKSTGLVYFYDRILLPPPLCLDREEFCIELGRRAHFLGACFLDAQNPGEGLKWLVRSLRCLSLSSVEVGTIGGSWSDSGPGTNSVVMQNPAVSELVLHSEEIGCLDLARAVASWSVDVGIGSWSDKMRRPGYSRVPSLLEECGINGANDSLAEIRPHYPEEIRNAFFPWTKVLEENYDVIKAEFISLLHRKPLSSSTTGGECASPDGTNLSHPAHWPAVGSAEHRTGGSDDHRVVSSGGDWRECVLFGAGCGATSVKLDAPKTKALIRRYCPDAVSLAEMGGGEVIFSVLAPGTRIAPHCASTNVRLTAHLGLVVPKCETENNVNGEIAATEKRCTIRVANEWHNWKAGRVLVFDDTFEHEVVNSTNELRAVLLLRFWHPSIPIPERGGVLEEMMRLKGKDAIRRYNPPLSPELKSAEARGMGWSSCQKCGGSGHEHLRLFYGIIDVGNSPGDKLCDEGLFTCACGHGI